MKKCEEILLGELIKLKTQLKIMFFNSLMFTKLFVVDSEDTRNNLNYLI